MKNRFIIFCLLFALVVISFASCSKDTPYPEGTYKKVVLLYSAGYNNLCSDLREDIMEMCQDAPTPFLSNYYKVLVFSHLKKSAYDETPVSPVLIDATIDSNGKVKLDTLERYSLTASSATSQMLDEVLKKIKKDYSSKEYGMIISSHANGWLPAGYFTNPKDDDGDDWNVWNEGMYLQRNASMSHELYYFAEHPEVKALCYQDPPRNASYGTIGEEIDLVDFAAAIRANNMHFSYIVFDMCLMGGVEVAYELKDIVDYVAFSPTEVITDGFAYKTILQRLLYSSSPDIVGASIDYFDQYVKSRRSATVSTIDCRKMNYLAAVCKDLFARYYARIMALDHKQVQTYCEAQAGGIVRRYFFDLKDALVKAGITDSELSSLDAALRECVLYHNETSSFSVSGEYFKLENCCGFSMYLPSDKRPVLNASYMETSWNKATSLVR